MTENGVPSPYAPVETADKLKERLGKYLVSLRLPTPADHAHSDDCARDCHILERNYMVELVRNFLFKN